MRFTGLLIEKETKKDIDLFLSNVTGGLILLGDKGIGKSLCAKQIACAILDSAEKELEINPDYYYVEADKDVVKIEQIQEMKSRCGMVASRGNQKVFVINDADKMTVPAQNAILKVLEDGNKTNIIIFVAQKALLSTIHSRCTVIKFKKPEEQQIRAFLASHEEIDDVALAMAEGRIGFYNQLMRESELRECLKNIITVFNSMENTRELLGAFNLLKEKDKKCFFERFETEYVMSFLQLMKAVFTDVLICQYSKSCRYPFFDYVALNRHYTAEKIMHMASRLESDLLRMQRKGAYGKNDFFDLVRNMV